jgi:hypothetical protein
MSGRNFLTPLVQLVVINMACYNLPANNCTSGATKFLLDVKELFDKPLEEKKRRYRYEIYK